LQKEGCLTPDAVRLVFTCEHAAPNIPAAYGRWFRGRLGRFPAHRVVDAGASDLADRFARRFKAPLHRSRFSRMLVDLNRSEGHPRLFSEISRVMPADLKAEVLNGIYRPYRSGIVQRIDGWLLRGFIAMHVSVHTFSPRWNGRRRRTDVGLLFDPGRRLEKRICAQWRSRLKRELPGLKVHFNRPYRGTSNGFTTDLRKNLKDGRYAGIEIEVNQRFFGPDRAAEGRRVCDLIVRSLEGAVSDLFKKSISD
jgi:predicted N-formylglutamate amidohydrolase